MSESGSNIATSCFSAPCRSGDFNLYGAGTNSHGLFASATSPDDEPSKRDVDRLIASELNRISLEERERAMHDVHALPAEREETSGFMESCLSEMDNRLQEIRHNTFYDIAANQSPEYVSAMKFRLLFLRSSRYDPIAAANKMIKFFEIKKELWGVDKLCKDITLADFDQDDLAALHTGYGQISPLRDMAGRPIVVFLSKCRKFRVVENAVSAFRCSRFRFIARILRMAVLAPFLPFSI
jgi:hypothetical protein